MKIFYSVCDHFYLSVVDKVEDVMKSSYCIVIIIITECYRTRDPTDLNTYGANAVATSSSF